MRIHWTIILTLSLISSAHAQTVAKEAEAVKTAAMYYATGTTAAAECERVGYTVKIDGWNALVSRTAPIGGAKSFLPGQMFAEPARLALEYVNAVKADAGAEAWCAYIAAWAKVTYPETWQTLIVRKGT